MHDDGENVHKVHANLTAKRLTGVGETSVNRLSAKRQHPVQRVARPHMLRV